MQVLIVLVVALMACNGSASNGIPTQVLSSDLRQLLFGTYSNMGAAVLLTDDQLDKVVDYVTAGCYTDPELVPGALKKCVGTSANLIRQLLEILESSIIGVYKSSEGPSQELVEQAVCFVRGLNLISDDGSLNQPGLDKLTDSMRDSADLRIYTKEAVCACTNSESESKYMALCLQRILLQKCRFVEA